MKPSIQLYDKKNIDTIIWPNSHTGLLGEKYLLPLITQDVNTFINNIKTELYIIKIGNEIIPVTINSDEWENSYICSPYTHYVSYLLEEIQKLDNKITVQTLSILIRGIGKILRQAKVNKVAMVNNWLFSTNMYPLLAKEQIVMIIDLVRATFPDHAIIFKSVDSYQSKNLLHTLKGLGGLALGARKVYFWNPNLHNTKTQHARKYFRGDRSVRRSSPYHLVKCTKEDVSAIKRIQELYTFLYLDKYSYHNPQYNETFFKLAIENNFLDIYTLKYKTIDGVIAFYTSGNTLVSPIVGYDTSFTKDAGLYRILLLKATEEAAEKEYIFHASSGVGKFKKNRGCISAIEYMVVFTKDISLYRRIIWLALSYIVNSIGIPLLNKYEI